MRPRACVLAFVTLTLLLSATSAHAETRLDVDVGFDGFVLSGEVVPVRVQVDADRLVRGRIVVTGEQTGTQRTEVDVEIPGGSVKTYVLAVGIPPSISTPTIGIDLVDDDGRAVASQDATASEPPADQDLVGLLPRVLGSRPLPGTAPLAIDVGTARFVRVAPELLARPELLRSLGTIGATTDDLAALAPAAQAGLRRWVAEGGHLLVDVAAGAPIPGLPQTWRPETTAAQNAGLGAVRATDGAMAAGRWAGLIEPTGRAPSGLDSVGFGRSFGGTPFTGLLTDLGARLPPIGSLFGPLLLYAVIAGPVAYFLLRRRRRELWLWVAVPGLAVVVTVASYGAAIGLRGGAKSAHMTLLTTAGGEVNAVTYVGVSSPGGGETTVSYPRGWELTGGQLDVVGFGPPSETTADAVYTGEGFAGRLQLNPAEVGLAAGTGTSEIEDGLVVTARAEGSEVEGTVRNATPYALSEAAVLVGKDYTPIGDLEPGEERPWRMPATPQQAHFTLPGPQLWAGAAPFTAGGRTGDVNYDLWRLAGGRFGSDFLTTGVAVAVGWTDDFRPDVSVTATTAPPNGTSLVVGRTRVAHGSGPLTPLAIHREQVRGPQPPDPEPGSDELPSDEPMVLRYTLPARTGGALVLQAPENLARLEVWGDGGWQDVYVDPSAQQQQSQQGGVRSFGGAVPFGYRHGPGGPSGPEVPMTDHELPQDVGLRAGDVVYVRISQNPDTGIHAAWGYTLREVP